MQPIIVEASVSGSEVGAILANRLIPAIADLDRGKALLALLTCYIVLTKPDATAEEVKSGVSGAANWFITHLSCLDADLKPHNNMVN